MIKLSFTLRVLVISFVVLALPLLIDSFIFFQSSYVESIQDARGRLKELASFRKYTLEEIQPVKQILLKELEYFLNLEETLDHLNYNELDKKLAVFAHRSKDLQIFILKEISPTQYEVVASSLPELYETPFKSYRMLGNIKRVGGGSFFRYIRNPIDNQFVPYAFVARYIQSASGDGYFVMAASQVGSEFKSVLTKTLENENVNFAILDLDGLVLDSSLPSLKGHYFNPLSAERLKEIAEADVLGSIPLAKNPIAVIKGTEFPYFEFIFNDEVQIAYYSYASEIGLSIVAFSSKQEFFGNAVSHFLVIYTIYGIVLIAGGGITYWISVWISRPLRELSNLMGEVSKGNMDVRFQEAPFGFEINLLGSMFNNTLHILLENIGRAEDERVKREIYEKELDIGRQVQKNLLPIETPEIEGAEVAGVYLPVKEAGGDFFQFFSRKTKTGEEALFFGVTDAAGKGIYSCLFAVSFRSLILSYASLYDDVGISLSKTNNAFIEDAGETGMFIKALQGVYYPKRKTLYYYSCGNIPGIVRKADGHLFSLEHSGMAIGLKESKEYYPDKIELETGDFVIFFTDGLVEAENDKHQMFGERRLKNLLQMSIWHTAQEMIEGVMAEIERFSGGIPHEQEITLVVLRIK